MEVPTVVSFSSLQQQPAEQIVDIPVLRTRRNRGGLQGFHPGKASSQRTVEQIVDIPVGGGLQDFLPDPGLSASSAVWRDEAFQGFFSTFPRVQKSAQSAGRSSARVHGRSSPCAPAAYQAEESLSAFECESIQHNDVWCARQCVPAWRGYAWWIIDDHPYGGPHGSCDGGAGRGGCGRLWDHAAQVPAVFRVHHRASDFVHRQSAGHSSRYAQCQTVQGTVPVVVQRQVPEQGARLSRGLHRHTSVSEEFLFLGFLLALFALGCWCIISSWPRIWQSLFLSVGVACGVLKTGFFGGFCGYSGAMLGSTLDTCSASVLGALGRIAHFFLR